MLCLNNLKESEFKTKSEVQLVVKERSKAEYKKIRLHILGDDATSFYNNMHKEYAFVSIIIYTFIVFFLNYANRN